MTAHSEHRPSAAHRWMNCPGSVALSRGFDDSSSVFAREGTAAHHMAHDALEFGRDAEWYRGAAIDSTNGGMAWGDVVADGDRFFEVTAEMVDAVQIYLDVVRDLQEEGYELEFEQRLQTPIGEDVFGTGDAVGYNAERRRVAVVDFKYGKGVVVDPAGNEQLLTYASGVAMRHHNQGVDEAILVIVQPRAYHPDGPVRVAPPVTIAELQAHIEKAQAAIKSTELRPGPWCKFCPAAGFCPALRNRVYDAMGVYSRRPNEMAMDHPEEYSPGQLAEAMSHLEMIESYVKSVRRLAHNQGMKGEPPPGWKMVYSVGHRRFIRPEDVLQTMALYGVPEEDVFEPRKLRSPAQLEKELPKNARGILGPLTTRPNTKAMLAPESDPRPAIDPAADIAAFEDGVFETEED